MNKKPRPEQFSTTVSDPKLLDALDGITQRGEDYHTTSRSRLVFDALCAWALLTPHEREQSARTCPFEQKRRGRPTYGDRGPRGSR